MKIAQNHHHDQNRDRGGGEKWWQSAEIQRCDGQSLLLLQFGESATIGTGLSIFVGEPNTAENGVSRTDTDRQARDIAHGGHLALSLFLVCSLSQRKL